MDREQVVKLLRSILVVSNSAMAIHDLVKEFRESEQTNIPFRKFGYETFVEFLRMSDCFILKSTANGLMVSAKQLAHSKHMIDNINEQNVSNKRRKSSRKKRTKLLQHPSSPLEIIYENNRAMRYGTQSTRKHIQHQRNVQRDTIGSARVQCGPLAQLRNTFDSKQNRNNQTNDILAVGRNNENVIEQVAGQQPLQEQQNQSMASIDRNRMEQNFAITKKPAHAKLSKFSQALMRAMLTEPSADLMTLKRSEPQSKPFDFAELVPYRSAAQAIDVYCMKKMLPKPEYQFIEMNTKKIICSVTVNQTRYGCYPREYDSRDMAQKATAEIALREIKKLEENMNYPVCKDSAHHIAKQIIACIGENGIFLDSLQTVFESTYHQRLPDEWRSIIQHNADMFKLETDNFLGKTIVYPNKLNAPATGTIKMNNFFGLERLMINA